MGRCNRPIRSALDILHSRREKPIAIKARILANLPANRFATTSRSHGRSRITRAIAMCSCRVMPDLSRRRSRYEAADEASASVVPRPASVIQPLASVVQPVVWELC
jgi:hypothetical protein